MVNKFFIFITFFIKIYSEIINNPICLAEAKYPIVLSTPDDDYYYLITNTKNMKIKKGTGELVKENEETIGNLSEYIYIADNQNNNFLINNNCKCYKINYDNFLTLTQITIDSLKFEGQDEVKIMGSIARDEDFIIYGYYKDDIFFSSKSQQKYSLLSRDNFDKIKITCKFLEDEFYICARNINNIIHLNILKYHIEFEDGNTRNSLSFYSQGDLEYETIDEIYLYDTPHNRIKIICIKISQNIKCDFLRILDFGEEQENYELFNTNKMNFNTNYFSENNCYFSEFNSEFLFCCATQDCILCYRIDKTDFNIFEEYKLNSEGDNSHLTIKSNNNFITFFYMNDNEFDVKVFAYYIYLPICKNVNYTILNSLNWNKSENEMKKISDLFIPSTNNHYYINLINPDEYGYFTLNNSKLVGSKDIIDNNYILDFLITNKNINSDIELNINYLIFISLGNKAYTKECQIGLNIKPCYKSCDLCSKDNNSSNKTQHNCIKCKNDYYPSPEKNENCYSNDDKEINWYFNTNSNKFSLCNEKCKSCFGPNENECTSCSKGLYLENGSCKDNCSEGYSKIKLNEGDYFLCEECYKNCKTCSKIGIDTDMECETCKDEYIKYQNNCYKISDQSTKTFYFDENDNKATNCFEKFQLYIKEDSYECIDKIEKGYYISNPDTGVLSKCYDNCLLCDKGPIYNIDGNLENMGCLECQNLNNQVEQMIKLNDNCFKVIRYDENQIIFNISEIKPDNPFGNCFDFGKAIFYGQYECIDKPNNTYFALNNNSNTGVIKDCQKVCGSCENKDDRNCIECSTNCNKEERINTYNLFTESISQSSFLNINNTLINGCHQNCKSCNDSYNYTIDDMNCFECIDGFYFIYGEKNCYNNSILQNNKYYFNSKDSMFHKCYNTCSECSNFEPNETNHNCIKCAENYFNLDNGLYLNNCYDNETIKNMLTLKESSIITSIKEKEDIFITTEKISYLECDISCLKCNIEISNSNCIECNIESGYYPIQDSNSTCYNNETILEGYYLDKINNPYIWKKCYSKCETCNSQGNDDNMNCLSCKTQSNSNVRLINGNCINGCLNNEFIAPNGSCVLTCPNGTYQYLFNNSCLESCPNNYEINEDNNKCILKTFIEEITVSEFKSQIRNEITSFVNTTKVINSTNFMAVVLTSDKMNPEEQLKKGISAVDLGNCTQVIKDYYNISREENLIVLNMESKNDESQKNESTNNDNKSSNSKKNTQLEIYDSLGNLLDISVCKEDLKVMKYIGDIKEINIESAMSLSEQGIDLFNPEDSFFNDICSPYDNPDGKDIILNDRRNDMFQNISLCQDGCTYAGMNYELMAANCLCNSSYLQENNNTKSKKDKETVTFKSLTDSFISNLVSFNTDVLRCFNLALNLKILFHNIGFYSLFSMFILQIVVVFIYFAKKLQSLRNFMLQFKNKKKNKMNNYNNINIHKRKSLNVINNNKNPSGDKKIKLNPTKKKNNNKLMNDNYKRKFKIKNIEKSKFKINKKIKIKKNELNLSNNSSDKNMSSENNFNCRNSIQNDNLSNIYNFQNFPKSKNNSKKNLLISNNNFSQNIFIQTPIINIQKDLPEREKFNFKNPKKEKKINLNNIFDKEKSKDNYIELNEFKNKVDKKNLINPKINKEIISRLSQTYYEMQDLDYEEALIYDKRSYFKMYWEFLVDSQIILGTFCTDNHLDLFIIKLSFFICTFQISFFLNALFYSDEYISDAYHNDGVLDFFSGLPKSIYSLIATLITTNLLRMLSSSKGELIQVIKNKRNYNNYVNIINNKLSKLSKKLIIYFILIFLIKRKVKTII